MTICIGQEAINLALAFASAPSSDLNGNGATVWPASRTNTLLALGAASFALYSNKRA
jgi:hypothetical protein